MWPDKNVNTIVHEALLHIVRIYLAVRARAPFVKRNIYLSLCNCCYGGHIASTNQFGKLHIAVSRALFLAALLPLHFGRVQ